MSIVNGFADSPVVVIGIDGGGTKTVAVLADANGRELARSVGAGANLQTVGAVVVRERIGALIGDLLSGVTGASTVRGLAVSLAGVDRPADVPVATEAILGAIADFTASGQSTAATPSSLVATRFASSDANDHDGQGRAPHGPLWELPGGLPIVTNDAVAALAAGASTLDGVVVIAGTGSIAFGVCNGVRARAGGWGSILGDEGSGFGLGIGALRAVCRAHDGRAPATSLAGAVLAQVGASTPPDLIGIVSAKTWGVAETAAVAPVVVREAEAGDAVASELVDEAASELVASARAVIDALPFERSRDLPIVLAGGLWPASARLRDGFASRLSEHVPNARPSVSAHEPVEGAVWLARHQAGLLPATPSSLIAIRSGDGA